MLDLIPTPSAPLTRPTSVVSPLPEILPSFELGSANRSYKHQYANIYFIRLRKLRGFVEISAKERWDQVKGNPVMVPRVLEVKKGELCWIVGTVYMEMPLKPNILEDIAKDFSIPPPPPPPKYLSADDTIVLEDESGRIALVGDCLKQEQYVTGIIMAALGIETPDGSFEVIDVCFAGMAPHPTFEMPVEDENEMIFDGSPAGPSKLKQCSPSGSWIALLSGLELSTSYPLSSETELHLQLLIEHILSESGNSTDQEISSQISRLIIVGNSMLTGEDHLKSRHIKTGPIPSPLSSPATSTFSKALQEMVLAVPIHLLPGASDPSGTILPQQPMPRAMFGEVRKYNNFRCETNPTWLVVDGRTILATSGQTLDDMYKYLETDDRLGIASRTLEWRHMAPTAPDTLWCHPYPAQDPFILNSTPHIYVIGNQPSFATTLVTATLPSEVGDEVAEGSRKRSRDGAGKTGGQVRSRVILLPKFSESAMLVLVHTHTLECKTVQVGVDTRLLRRDV